MRAILALLAVFFLSGCDGGNSGGPLEIVVIGQSNELLSASEQAPASAAVQHFHAATQEGLVALDPSGEIVPAIAERWIVTDDGMSYIFRLRDSGWSEEEPITAEDVQALLQGRIEALSGTALGLDLEKVDQIRAMTGRVIEIQLKGPMPDFLRLVAQPEMGLVRAGSGVGPMLAERPENEARFQLLAMAPELRGLPARSDWEDLTRPLFLRTAPAELAVGAFAQGEADLVLAGTLAHLPLADTGPLSAGTVRLDAPLGLFGFQILRAEGLLSEPGLREAIAMAIDRETLMQPFNFGGWQASTWIYPISVSQQSGPQQERWSQLSLDQRRGVASRRVAAWVSSQGGGRGAARISIALPEGPGSDLLFSEISEDLAAIGVTAARASPQVAADLVLRDELARYFSPRWYLNQFHCGLDKGLCSAEADALVQEALESRDLLEKHTIYAEAQQALISQQVFIPLGQPVRWSLVRAGVNGFEENQWGHHALFPLSLNTI